MNVDEVRTIKFIYKKSLEDEENLPRVSDSNKVTHQSLHSYKQSICNIHMWVMPLMGLYILDLSYSKRFPSASYWAEASYST